MMIRSKLSATKFKVSGAPASAGRRPNGRGPSATESSIRHIKNRRRDDGEGKVMGEEGKWSRNLLYGIRPKYSRCYSISRIQKLYTLKCKPGGERKNTERRGLVLGQNSSERSM